MLNKKLLGSVSSAPATYVEDVFSTYLYTGTGASLSIDNGIDLAGEGGLVWFKRRDAVGNNSLSTTGITGRLLTDTTGALNTNPLVDSYNSNGFSTVSSTSTPNQSGGTFASWTFRKQPKFFDVVTYTGNGTTQNINHNLGSIPGMIIIKQTNGARDWLVYHRSTTATSGLLLNLTSAALTHVTYWNNTTPTSTQFSLGGSPVCNNFGSSYVAYLFAHDAGGFGTAGTDNVISCGSFTTDGSGIATVNLGYEPQWVMVKQTSPNTGAWFMFDNMRGMAVQLGGAPYLRAESSNAETADGVCQPQSTGFLFNGSYVFGTNSSATFIYMAIRRPMKPPTSGTEVFSPITSSASTGTQLTTNFVVDSQWINYRAGASENTAFNDRLRGNSSTTTSSGNILISSSTAAESSVATTRNWGNTGFEVPSYYSGGSTIYWNFRRATGFFDVVCYTGTESARTVAHNLGVAPELMIVKCRNAVEPWRVYNQTIGATKYLDLNTVGEAGTASLWNNTAPTSSVFSLSDSGSVNGSGQTYVAYLFATCPGVSKVGSYTGTGATQTINCGFTGGARFVMVKATSTTGDWIVVDTARGLVSGNDPTLSLNSTAAEVTTNDWFDPVSSGFELSSASGNLANTNGVSYIYMAIA